ncbi:hypothetical protein A9995_09525 [Erythrobacter sp. QSSC1-22B]|uniref:manganese efflux pump MntP n=1 Tax=Erythrobacter sp. QSSC1-22B TaxID=1860125 RepID=UPI0008048E62|nr:manganese efflux pump MntP family protein [Erythrobacter sp. QSSC1-22B]OBX18800.1 hypothetical protein A9995_09525 [Erythrobacter sp. QSSC1-22B]
MIEGLFLAFALAMDAFAVALTQGARFRPRVWHGLGIAAAFGLAQGIMPLIGWALGAAALVFIAHLDHWIASVLLGLLGIQMIRGSGDDDAAPKLRGMALLVAAIATSIDALAAGITLPTLELSPLVAAGLIAAVTFVLSAAGVLSGRIASDGLGRWAERAGGVILIALGTKILAEHSGYL